MKDYYYFFGVKSDASETEIKQAYRKLSLKFHPDKNENDEFFADRFREIQEAYDTLGNSEKRKIYDQEYASHRPSRSTLPPSIKTFSSTKIRVSKGEEVTVKWNTLNADVVKVLPFGLEKPYGERTFKITEFKDGKFVVLLHASNSLTNQTAVQGITITELKEREKKSSSAYQNPNAEEVTSKKSKGKVIVDYRKLAIAVGLILLAVYFLIRSL